MGKVIFSVFFLALLAVANVADALNVKLVTHNQRSSSGTRSTLSWKSGPGCVADNGGNYSAPCLNPTAPWVVNNGVTGSNATWDWNPATQVLTGTGLFWTTSFIGSNPNGSPVISDKVTDLIGRISHFSCG